MLRALAVALAVAGLVPAAVAAPTATVRVTDTSVSPVRVRVDAGGTVTWRNTGARPHRIASRTRAFATFTLAPGSRRSVRFRRNGRHTYTVDGRRCGVVFVGVRLGAGCSAAGSGGGGAGARPRPGQRTYRYDITVRGLMQYNGASEYVDRGGDVTNSSEWDLRASWTSTYRNVRLRVAVTGNQFFVFPPASSFAGTTRVTERWRWVRRGAAEEPLDCLGQAVRNKPAFGIVTASNSSVLIELKLRGPWEGPGAMRADCDSSVLPPGQRDYPHRPFGWHAFEVRPNTIELGFVIARRGGGLATPARELATGRRVVLDTGLQTTQESGCEASTGATCQYRQETGQRYIVVFTPRR